MFIFHQLSEYLPLTNRMLFYSIHTKVACHGIFIFSRHVLKLSWISDYKSVKWCFHDSLSLSLFIQSFTCSILTAFGSTVILACQWPPTLLDSLFPVFRVFVIEIDSELFYFSTEVIPNTKKRCSIYYLPITKAHLVIYFFAQYEPVCIGQMKWWSFFVNIFDMHFDRSLDVHSTSRFRLHGRLLQYKGDLVNVLNRHHCVFRSRITNVAPKLRRAVVLACSLPGVYTCWVLPLADSSGCACARMAW